MNDYRKRARTRREWLEVQRNLPSDAHPYERQLIEYALRKRDVFPRSQEVEVSLPSVSVVAPATATTTTEQSQLDIDLTQLLAESNHERSIDYLEKLEVPAGYNPSPTLNDLAVSFEKNNYFVNKDDIFSIHQAISSGRPIKVDGPPGVGKSELAKQIVFALGLDVNNPFHFGELFCTPDISKGEAFYSWHDAKRLIDMQLATQLSHRMNGEQLKNAYLEVANNSFSSRYLDLQVLLRACVIPYRTVVLIDECDKAYHEFDSYLLDVIDKNRFVVPEFGSVGRKEFNKKTSPIFILTSNMTRALSGPLVRRCKSLFYDYLPETLEDKVLRSKTTLDKMQCGLIAHFFHKLRGNKRLHLQQAPSTAEVIETARALQESGLEVTEKNLLRLHCHWVKYRVDFNAIASMYRTNQGDWVENISQ